MDKTYLLMLGVLILLVLPTILSQTYQKGAVIDLKIPFEVNGSIASSSATCNVSIDYPDGSYLKENASMTNRDNGDFNITLLGSEINQLGTYDWRDFCCDGSQCAAGYGSFEVTESGKEKISSGEGLSLFGSSVVIIIIGLFFFAISFKFKSPSAKIICVGLAAIVFIIALLFSLVILTQTFGGFSTLTESYTTFWFVMRIIITVVLTFFALYCMLVVFRWWKIKRGLLDAD